MGQNTSEQYTIVEDNTFMLILLDLKNGFVDEIMMGSVHAFQPVYSKLEETTLT